LTVALLNSIVVAALIHSWFAEIGSAAAGLGLLAIHCLIGLGILREEIIREREQTG